MKDEKKLKKQTERKKHDEKLGEFCPKCYKPMWKYTFVGGSYFYCSFCHLSKDFVRIRKNGKERP